MGTNKYEAYVVERMCDGFWKPICFEHNLTDAKESCSINATEWPGQWRVVPYSRVVPTIVMLRKETG